MKKLLALLLCCTLLAGLLAACGSAGSSAPPFAVSEAEAASDASGAETDAVSEQPDESDGINYKGLSSRSATLEDIKAAEGRNPDLEFTSNDVTYYVYNEVTMEDLTFTQVQFSFSETSLRVSCTSSAETGTEETVASWKEAISALYGTASEGGGIYTWYDEGGNYVTLCAINETTAQLAFYLCK